MGLNEIWTRFLLRGCAGDDEDADAGAEVLFGGGVDLVDGDGVEQGVAASPTVNNRLHTGCCPYQLSRSHWDHYGIRPCTGKVSLPRSDERFRLAR